MSIRIWLEWTWRHSKQSWGFIWNATHSHKSKILLTLQFTLVSHSLRVNRQHQNKQFYLILQSNVNFFIHCLAFIKWRRLKLITCVTKPSLIASPSFRMHTRLIQSLIQPLKMIEMSLDRNTSWAVDGDEKFYVLHLLYVLDIYFKISHTP